MQVINCYSVWKRAHFLKSQKKCTHYMCSHRLGPLHAMCAGCGWSVCKQLQQLRPGWCVHLSCKHLCVSRPSLTYRRNGHPGAAADLACVSGWMKRSSLQRDGELLRPLDSSPPQPTPPGERAVSLQNERKGKTKWKTHRGVNMTQFIKDKLRQGGRKRCKKVGRKQEGRG